jgi:hypothetical protein
MSGKFTAALRDTQQIDVSVTGRVSGRRITVPVWFVEENGTVDLLPVHGSDSDWYKNALAAQALQLTAEEASITGEPRRLEDPARVQEVVSKFQAKYGADQIAAYYPKTDVALEVSVQE